MGASQLNNKLNRLQENLYALHTMINAQVLYVAGERESVTIHARNLQYLAT